MQQTHVLSHFPCGEGAFRTTVVNSDNAPEIQIGDSIVVDPDVTPTAGDFVLTILDNTLFLRRVRPLAKGVALEASDPSIPARVVPALDDSILVGAVTETCRARKALNKSGRA